MSRPWSIRSVNTLRHERPKWMLWWAICEYCADDPANSR